MPYRAPAVSSPGVALADPVTRAALPGPRRSLLAGALVGVVLMVVGFATHLVVARGSDDLRAHGVRVVGTVQEVHDHWKSTTTDIEVTFLVTGRPVRATVTAGLFAPVHERGDRVVVFHAADDPQRLTIDDVDALRGGWVQVVSFLGLLGPVWLLAAVVQLVGDRRARARLCRTLAGGPWSAGPVRVGFADGDPRFGDLDETATVLTTPDGVPWLAEQSWPDDRSAWAAPRPEWVTGVGWADMPEVHEREGWWVADGDTAFFSPDRGAPLLLARRRG